VTRVGVAGAFQPLAPRASVMFGTRAARGGDAARRDVARAVGRARRDERRARASRARARANR
tara:strand:- start:4221 stop:4406 length:186 start_codon:yes stop_codon:yes gene_type:complete